MERQLQEVNMNNKKVLAVLTFTVLTLSLLLCGCVKKIAFSAGKVSDDITELAVVLQEGETALLDNLPLLEKADFSGSKCLDEITAWAESHPQVDVIYTVELPNGESADKLTQALDLSSLDSEQLMQAVEAFKYLPELKNVKIGSQAQGVSIENAVEFSAACPDIHTDYSFTLNGKSCTLDDESLDLVGIKRRDIEELVKLLPSLSKLRTVELGAEETKDASIEWEDIAQLVAAAPEADFNYSFTLYDKKFNLNDTEMDINHIKIYDNGELVRRILPCMSKLSYLDMDFCNVSNEDMAAIRDEFPNVKVVWRVWFGDNYSVRTDVEKILASRPVPGGALDDSDMEILKYCTDVKYLDIGHNPLITDLSFAKCMPNLEVAVLAMNGCTDISALAECKHLEFLEIFSTNVSDLSPLSELKELRHLNIQYMPYLTDISPLYGLTELERLWIGCNTPIPAEQVEKMHEYAPDCEIDTTTMNNDSWRYTGYNEKAYEYILHPRYALLREQFGYSNNEFSFSWLDPKYNPAPNW